MKRIVISSKGQEPPVRMRFWQKVMLGYTIINLLLAFCLAIYSIAGKWGNSTIAIVWLVLLCFYVVVFVFVVLLSRKKSGAVLNHRLGYSLAALKLLTSASNLLNLLLTLFQLLAAFFDGDISGVTTIASIIMLLLFTILGIVLKINSIIKRREKYRKKQAKLKAKTDAK